MVSKSCATLTQRLVKFYEFGDDASCTHTVVSMASRIRAAPFAINDEVLFVRGTQYIAGLT